MHLSENSTTLIENRSIKHRSILKKKCKEVALVESAARNGTACYHHGSTEILVQCSPANPEQAGEEAVGLADLSGLPNSFCVLVGE